MGTKQSNLWRARGLTNGNEWVGPLRAVYEVNLSSVSDDYEPETTSAEDLLDIWIKYALKSYPEGYISISWYVESKDVGIFEGMPFQHDHPHPHYSSRYTWPIHAETGDALDWLSLPVEDMRWRKGHADKCVFRSTRSLVPAGPDRSFRLDPIT